MVKLNAKAVIRVAVVKFRLIEKLFLNAIYKAISAI